MTPTTTTEPPHDCPGGCGRSVKHRHLACHNCWHLLPAERRAAIMRARSRRRRELVGEAITWYREHVRDGKLVNAKPAGKWVLDDWRPGR